MYILLLQDHDLRVIYQLPLKTFLFNILQMITTNHIMPQR